MVDPTPIPSSARANAVNHRTFFDKIEKDGRRLDGLDRRSIRSGSVGGDGLRFYDLDTGATTSHIGEFPGSRWDQALAEWVDVDAVRGMALYEEDSEDPWFIAATDGNTQFFQVGWGGSPVENILLSAVDIFIQSGSAISGIHVRDTEVSIASAGAIYLAPDSTANPLYFMNIPTVGAGDHLVLDGSQVKKISSALKYKQDIEDALVNPQEVLLLQGRTWRDKNEVAENPDTERRFIGFIADEIAEIPSLRQFVRFNENGEPETIHYDRLTVALLELLKTQQGQIDSINTRLDLLESMVKS